MEIAFLETVHESDCIFAFETLEIFRPEGILSQRGIHLNSNLNHLKSGLNHHSLSSAAQTMEKQGKVPQPTSRTGSNKIILLVCNSLNWAAEEEICTASRPALGEDNSMGPFTKGNLGKDEGCLEA